MLSRPYQAIDDLGVANEGLRWSRQTSTPAPDPNFHLARN